MCSRWPGDAIHAPSIWAVVRSCEPTRRFSASRWNGVAEITARRSWWTKVCVCAMIGPRLRDPGELRVGAQRGDTVAGTVAVHGVEDVDGGGVAQVRRRGRGHRWVGGCGCGRYCGRVHHRRPGSGGAGGSVTDGGTVAAVAGTGGAVGDDDGGTLTVVDVLTVVDTSAAVTGGRVATSCHRVLGVERARHRRPRGPHQRNAERDPETDPLRAHSRRHGVTVATPGERPRNNRWPDRHRRSRLSAAC